MNCLTKSFLRFSKSPYQCVKNPDKTTVIIRRPYAFLKVELFEAFEGNGEIDIIVDRRFGERRTETRPVAMDRRTADRRRSEEEIVQLLISP